MNLNTGYRAIKHKKDVKLKKKTKPSNKSGWR